MVTRTTKAPPHFMFEGNFSHLINVDYAFLLYTQLVIIPKILGRRHTGPLTYLSIQYQLHYHLSNLFLIPLSSGPLHLSSKEIQNSCGQYAFIINNNNLSLNIFPHWVQVLLGLKALIFLIFKPAHSLLNDSHAPLLVELRWVPSLLRLE